VGREALNTVVSIIINNYNYARFLRATIDSALSQSYASIEVLVVDDGSTDQSRAIIDSYGDRIRPVLKKNGGQASALNAGFAMCQGNIVIFLDADDVLLPHAVRRVADVFAAQPPTAKVQYRMEVIDQGGHQTGVIKPPRHIPLLTGDLKKQEMLFPFDLSWLPTSGNAFATRALRNSFPIPEEVYGQVGADWYVAHLTPLYGPVVSLDEVCAYYRVHASNNYELTELRLDLAHIRQTIVYCDYTRGYLLKYAEQLDVPDRPAEILSVSYVANRITSLKLEPDQHPIVGDTAVKLFKLALIAIARRSDVAWPMKVMFGMWFAFMVIAPKSLAHWLAEAFFFPERRTRLNHWLGTLHRSGQGA
jgi:glycosyltransferase involved in cell wall biosynthesis